METRGAGITSRRGDEGASCVQSNCTCERYADVPDLEDTLLVPNEEREVAELWLL